MAAALPSNRVATQAREVKAMLTGEDGAKSRPVVGSRTGGRRHQGASMFI